MSRHYRSGSQQQDKNKHKHIFTCLFNCHGRIASKLNSTELYPIQFNPMQSNIIHFRLGFFNLIESHDLSLIWALLCLTYYSSCICIYSTLWWRISFNCNILIRVVWLHLSTLFHWVKLPWWRFFLMQKRILRQRMRWVEEYASLHTLVCYLVCVYSCSFSLSISLITKEVYYILMMILLMSIDVSFLSLLL